MVMVMNYWVNRLEKEQYKTATQELRALEKAYKLAIKNINTTIKSYINDFAENNEISYKKALERLTSKQLELFKWTLEDYIKEAQKDPYNRQVINSSIKARLSRLEALKIQIGFELDKLYSEMEKTTEKVLDNIAQESYYKTLYNTDGTDFHILDDKTIKSFTQRKWVGDGLNYSQRIWNDRKKLANTLEKGLMEHLVTGGNINKVINNLTGFVDEKVYNRRAVSARLVYTEMSAVRSVATEEAYQELGVEKYKILATLDNRTSQICRNMDGKVFDKKDYQVGVTAPPFHINCRSTTVPYFDDEDTEGERVARGDDNKQYNIPSKMTYDEWYKEYVLKKGDKSGIIELNNLDNSVIQKCLLNNIKYRGIEKYSIIPSEEKIISELGGGDLTEGSCSSLAFAYTGNKNGYRVLDFRDGISRVIFARDENIIKIAELEGVKSWIVKEKNDFVAMKKLIANIEVGKDYYLAIGKHASIIRKTQKQYEYLELQSAYDNGFKRLDDKVLKKRFGCQKSHSIQRTFIKVPSVLIDVDTLKNNEEFKQLLGFINTAEDKQVKGEDGYEK